MLFKNMKGICRLVFILTLMTVLNLTMADLSWWVLICSFWLMKSFEDAD